MKHYREERNGNTNRKERLEVRKDRLPIRKRDELREDSALRRIFDFEGRTPHLP